MRQEKLKRAIQKLDATNTDTNWDGLKELKALGSNIPKALLDHYRVSKQWKSRATCVFFAVPYARESDDAVQLGLEGLWDKSRAVRYRACSLLAYSLKMEVLPKLKELLTCSDAKTREDACAAIDAIENSNHHWFIDRKHTGRLTWTVENEEEIL